MPASKGMCHRLGLVGIGLLDAAFAKRRAQPGVDTFRERRELRGPHREVPDRRDPPIGGIGPVDSTARQSFESPLQGEVMRRVGPAQRDGRHGRPW